MTVISASKCAKAYPRTIIASELCGQDLKSKHAPLIQACGGDSGGPFIHQTAQGPVQIGITSWGPEAKDAKCGTRPLPGVYMRVSSFASFINDPNRDDRALRRLHRHGPQRRRPFRDVHAAHRADRDPLNARTGRHRAGGIARM